jgi:hypothetical protein
MKGKEAGREEEVTKVEDLLSELSLTIVSSSERSDSSRLAVCNDAMSIEKEEEEQGSKGGNRNSLDSIVQKLNSFDPNTIFTIIIPSLFLITANNDVALQSLITIVSTNPNRYTLPALNAILTYIQQNLTISNDNHDNVINFLITNDLLHTIFQQVQHSSLSISNVATKVLFLLGTKLPPSMQQRQITSNILLLLYTHFQQLVRSDDKEQSILLIRYLSLMLEIFTNVPNNNNHNMVQSYLHVHTLSDMSTISILLLDDTNTTRTTTTTTATTMSTMPHEIHTSTIFDPILDVLQVKNQNDPLLIMNIFDILENMTNYTSSLSSSSVVLLLSWIECYMIDFLLSKVGFHFSGGSSSSGSSSSGDGHVNTLCSNGDVDTFCYASALTILSKCCSNASGDTNNNIDNNNNSNDKNNHKLTPSMMIAIFKYILHSIISESYDDIEKIHYIYSLVTFIRSNDPDDDDDNNNSASHRLKLILDDSDIIEFWFDLKQGNVKYKAAVLNSIAQVLQYTTVIQDGDNNNDMRNISNEMCMSMYATIGNINNNIPTTDMLMELVKSSIVEIRLATYQVFQSIIKNRSKNSGQYLLISHVGFLEMLLNRNLELVKEGKEMKYDIVCSILKSELKGYLNESVVNALEQFVDQGPYYYQGTSGDILLE